MVNLQGRCASFARLSAPETWGIVVLGDVIAARGCRLIGRLSISFTTK